MKYFLRILAFLFIGFSSLYGDTLEKARESANQSIASAIAFEKKVFFLAILVVLLRVVLLKLIIPFILFLHSLIYVLGLVVIMVVIQIKRN